MKEYVVTFVMNGAAYIEAKDKSEAERKLRQLSDTEMMAAVERINVIAVEDPKS